MKLKKETEKNEKTYKRIVLQIQQLIRDGSLAPGDQLLPERQLAETLNVSRNCVREALSVLEMMGLIEVTPGEGAYVKRASLESIIEPLATVLWKDIEGMNYLFEVRKIIEVNAVGLAAERADDTDLYRIREDALQVVRDIEAGVPADESDTNFHQHLIAASKNPILSELAFMLTALMKESYGPFRREMLSSPRLASEFTRQHLEIYEAIKNKDAGKARAVTLEHLELAEKELGKFK
ncbi:MAG: FadR/GntR family transcriptional regulator [Bacillota bacterium]